jgi:endo-1,4-beta-mannosidase
MTDSRRPSAHNTIETKPWLGVNYWSRAGGPWMWSRYDGAVVREELAVLAEHGLNVTRSFCFWPDFVPAPSQLDEDVLARFADFLEAHIEAGLTTIPTFIVGHMSGENWDPPWREGRDLYRDVWLVAQQAWFAEELARRFGSHPAISAWLVSNEMPLYGGPATITEIDAWARLIVQAVRAGGAHQPISLGDGAWGLETSGSDNGYSLRSLAPLLDFIGPHVYPMQDDQVRQFLTAAFTCELCDSFGLPVVLEEFGVSSDFSSDENAAHYYRQVLHTTLLAGAKGWLAWNNCDYDDIRHEPPYSHHVFELHFGLTDASGRPKPQLHELARFGEVLDSLGDEGWEPIRGDTAIIVPTHFETAFPFTTEQYRRDIRDGLFQSYIAAREADLPISLERERDGLRGGARLYLSPSTKLLTAEGLDRIGELVDDGAWVYLSVFAGSTTNQRGPWLSGFEELFGIRQLLRYGLVDTIVDDVVTLDFVESFGDIARGETLQFRAGGNASARAYLPVESVGAEVIAVDGAGNPALLRHRRGKGAALFCTYPLEYMAAHVPAVNPESTWRLYSAIAEAAGATRPVRVDDPRVLTGMVRRRDGRETVVFVNTSPDRVVVTPVTALDLELGQEGDLELNGFETATVAVTNRSALSHASRVSATGGAVAVAASAEGRDASIR